MEAIRKWSQEALKLLGKDQISFYIGDYDQYATHRTKGTWFWSMGCIDTEKGPQQAYYGPYDSKEKAAKAFKKALEAAKVSGAFDPHFGRLVKGIYEP